MCRNLNDIISIVRKPVPERGLDRDVGFIILYRQTDRQTANEIGPTDIESELYVLILAYSEDKIGQHNFSCIRFSNGFYLILGC